MERRSFLKGVFGGVAAGGLIIQASSSDVSEFASGVEKGAPLVSAFQKTDLSPMPEPGEFVYNHQGVILGVISRIDTSISTHDVTGTGEEYQRLIPAVMTRELRVVDKISELEGPPAKQVM